MSESKSHDGETLEAAIRRWKNDHEDPWDEHKDSRGRAGWYDILALHALTNLFVTLCREQPRTAGHWGLYMALYIAVTLLGAAGWGLWKLTWWALA
jgi:hypothetical protein